MAQHDYNIANGTGAAVRADLNLLFAAIVSQNSGAAEPGTISAYQWWFDTTLNLLKIRNAANTIWVNIASLVGTTWKPYWDGGLLDTKFVVQVSASVPSVQAGTFAGRPAFGTAGRLYIATDTKQWFRDTGAAWDDLFTTDVANAGGVPQMLAGTFGARPGAGTAGNLYVATDTFQFFRDNGVSWDELGKSGSLTVTTGNFAGNNTGNRTITTGLADCKLVVLIDTANNRWYLATENSPDFIYGSGTGSVVFLATTLDLIVSGADFIVGNRNPGPPIGANITGTTPYWIAFGT